MKLLRRMIRQIILEGPVKDSFDEAWFNVEEERSEFPGSPEDFGTMHKDQLRQSAPDIQTTISIDDDDIEELFDNKRDLKRLWNQMIDDNGLRSFWEGPKMKYFHSLSYYSNPKNASDELATGRQEDNFHDLSAEGFFKMYKKSGNKDEMSTYGVYNNLEQIPVFQKNFGVLISGRVTLATMEDAWTESRSKGSPVDAARHAGSGAPKRIMPTDDMIASLLFEEEDIKEFGKIGECIIDNWSVDAVVYNPKSRIGASIEKAAEQMAEKYNVPLLTSQAVLNDKG